MIAVDAHNRLMILARRKIFCLCHVIAAACLMVLSLGAPSALAAKRVSIELVLATDTSISIDAAEYRLQMSGIAEAFRNPNIIELIESLPDGVAICLVHWSVGHLNRVAVPWLHLNDRQSIRQFAALVEITPRLKTGRSTAIGDAIEFSARQIMSNTYEGDVQKIDVSGDERSNSGPPPREARDRAIANGITINGLTIAGTDLRLFQYYRSNVIGGPSAFVMTISGFEDFQNAIYLKLLRELTPSAATGTDPEAPIQTTAVAD